MSGDFLIACFWEEMDEQHRPVKKPDWKKGHDSIDILCDDMEKKGVVDPDIEHLGEDGCGDPEDIPEIRKTLHRYLKEVEHGYNSSTDDLAYLEFPPYRVWITGGTAYGNNPTEIYPAIENLNQLTVLEEVGLNPPLLDYKNIINKIVKVKPLQPLLIGIDNELDSLLEKELRNDTDIHKGQVCTSRGRQTRINKTSKKL
jgi:hypothetical protein